MRHSTLLLVLLVLTMLAATLIARARHPVERQTIIPRSTGYRININTADAATLCLLPSIGPNLAQRIIDYRTAHGPFARVDDLDQVFGIAERTAERVRPYATCGGQE